MTTIPLRPRLTGPRFESHAIPLEVVEHGTLSVSQEVPARLDELRLLKDGWMDGQGIAPSTAGLDWLSRAFSEHFPDDLRPPFLYPGPKGSVQAEWSLSPYDITLEIDLTGHRGEWHELNLETEAEVLRALSLDEPEGWQWLAERLRALPGGTA